MASKDKHLHFFPLCGQIRVSIAKNKTKKQKKEYLLLPITQKKKEKKVSIAIIYNLAQNDK